MKIGIVGLGNIGYSLLQGLSKSNLEETIIVYDHNKSILDKVQAEFNNIKISNCVENIYEKNILICICIRTEQIKEFILSNKKYFKDNQIIVFLSASVKLDYIKKLSGPFNYTFVRCITNINISSSSGYTFILKTPNEIVNKAVADLFLKVGNVKEVLYESQLDLLSLLTGTSPAIISSFYESLVESGIEIGIPKSEAQELIEDTIHQTLTTIKDNKWSAGELKQKVCTPGGIVEGQLKELENETDFKQVVVNWFPNILTTFRK